MTTLADSFPILCKLSGLLTEAKPGATLPDLTPATDHLFDIFGAQRLMFGSDWPVLNMASDYGTWVRMVEGLLSGLSEDDRARVWGGNAARFYSIEDEGL